ncbi:MFS transporter [Sneathiella aquimaris]|uniref:MFS transporter n=1 Tax=Sneathiella aquimaris TaxID=2599305 RepID=UPI00146A0462|nr:MFS transporter [Sneathiella aquimaris]
MSNLTAIRPVLPILIAASVILTISFGLRQSLGLFMPAITQDIAVTIIDFAAAIALQNLVWGFCQPVAGIAADKWGFRAVMVFGVLSYVAGMISLATADGVVAVVLGAGICVGVGMACASFAMTLSVMSRLVPVSIRSMALGVVSAAGSVGAMITAPYGQFLESYYDWRIALFGLVALAVFIIPAAWIVGRVDKEAPLVHSSNNSDKLSAGTALKTTLQNPSFVVMALAYFVCGTQLVFLTTLFPVSIHETEYWVF